SSASEAAPRDMEPRKTRRNTGEPPRPRARRRRAHSEAPAEPQEDAEVAVVAVERDGGVDAQVVTEDQTGTDVVQRAGVPTEGGRCAVERPAASRVEEQRPGQVGVPTEVPVPIVRVVIVVIGPGDVEGESAAVLGLEQRDAVAAVARGEGGRRPVGAQRAAQLASAAAGAQEAVARQRARAAERVLELRRQRGLGQRAAEYGAEVEGRGGSYAVVAPHVEEAGGERLVDARGGHERVALRAGQEQRRDAQVAGEAAVEHRADVPAAIDPVVRLAAQVECRFADERAQAALGHERLRAPRVTAEQRPWIARRCDLVLLVAVLERDVERQPARRVARVRAPALAFEVVALVAVQQERRERCLEVADLPGLDRRDDRAGGKTDAQLAAAEELLRAHRITDPIATQWAVALR